MSAEIRAHSSSPGWITAVLKQNRQTLQLSRVSSCFHNPRVCNYWLGMGGGSITGVPHGKHFAPLQHAVQHLKSEFLGAASALIPEGMLLPGQS